MITIWKIASESSEIDDRPIEEIGQLRYGTLPQGYRQLIPEPGNSPQPIMAGRVYELYVETMNAPHARSLFKLDSGRAILLDGDTALF
jgi:hypothetical protein